jgi:hypothetical protein
MKAIDVWTRQDYKKDFPDYEGLRQRIEDAADVGTLCWSLSSFGTNWKVEGKTVHGGPELVCPQYLFVADSDQKKIRIRQCIKTGSYIGYTEVGQIIILKELVHTGSWDELTLQDVYSCKKCGYTQGMHYPVGHICAVCKAQWRTTEPGQAVDVGVASCCEQRCYSNECPSCGYTGKE